MKTYRCVIVAAVLLSACTDKGAQIPAEETSSTESSGTVRGAVGTTQTSNTQSSEIVTSELAGASKVDGVYDESGVFIENAVVTSESGDAAEIGEWILTKGASKLVANKSEDDKTVVAVETVEAATPEVESKPEGLVITGEVQEIQVVNDEGEEIVVSCESSGVECKANDNGDVEMTISDAVEVLVEGEAIPYDSHAEEPAEDAPATITSVKETMNTIKADIQILNDQIKAERLKTNGPIADRKVQIDIRNGLKLKRTEIRNAELSAAEKKIQVAELNEKIKEVNEKISGIQAVLRVHSEKINEMKEKRKPLSAALKDARDLYNKLRLEGTTEMVVSCSSWEFRDESCPLNLAKGSKIISFGLKKQISKSECKKGESYGKTGRSHIWVKAGCRAEFSLFVK